MRTTSDTRQFKKDYKREAKGQHRSTLDDELLAVLRYWQPIDRWMRSIVTMR